MCAEPLTTPSGPQLPVVRDLVGQTLRGTYRILGVLDQGGMGMVFEAQHVRLQRRVAVKVLAQHLAGIPNALARFHREAEIISRLQHPHIVQVVDFDTTDDGAPYIVMELLHGESLADRLDRVQRLELPEAVRIASQIASGLSFAHSASVVHRDLKPANIFLVDLPGQPSYVKLLDFGISKHAAAAGLTGEFDVLGTPDYMAPEQARGLTATVDHRADQFALAAISYEMVSGRLPFAGDDLASVLSRVINDDPPPLAEVAPALPGALDEVLRRGLAKDAAQRFADVSVFANALATAAGCSVPPQPVAQEADTRSARAGPDSSTARTEVAIDDRESGISLMERGDFTPTHGNPIKLARDPRSEPPIIREPEPPAESVRVRRTPDNRRAVDLRAEPQDVPRDHRPDPRSATPRDRRSDPDAAPPRDLRSDPGEEPLRNRRADLGAVPLRHRRSDPPSRLRDTRVLSARPDPRVDPPVSEGRPPTPSPESHAGGLAARPTPDAPPAVLSAIDQARLAMGLGDTDLAVDYAESALRLAQLADSQGAREALERSATLLDLIYEARLGRMDRVIIIRKPPDSAGRSSVTPEQAFLLSRLEGGETPDEALDLCPIPRRDCIRLLVSLLRRGIIELE